MAQVETVALIDDLDGTTAEQTVTFSVDGAFVFLATPDARMVEAQIDSGHALWLLATAKRKPPVVAEAALAPSTPIGEACAVQDHRAGDPEHYGDHGSHPRSPRR